MRLALPAFWQNVITVLSGTAAAQALPILTAPLITRLCTPDDMGVFSLWLGAMSIGAIAATLRLETAIILDHDRADQANCLGVVAHFGVVLALLMIFGAIAARALGLIDTPGMSWFALCTVGLGALLGACMQMLSSYATSYRAFRHAAYAKICSAGGIVASQLILLALGLGSTGLIAGQLTGLCIGMIAAIALLSPPMPEMTLRLTAGQRTCLRKHQAFWRFSLPADLLNVVAGQLPVFMIGLKFGVLEAGLFALTRRVMAAPVSLLGASVLEVFKRESVQELQTAGHCRQAYAKTFKTLVLLGAGPSLFIFAFAPDLFAWVFGEEWRRAGTFGRIMAPYYFLNFVASPLSYVLYIAGAQKADLLWQCALFVMTATAFLLPLTLEQSLWAYALGYFSLYIVYLMLSYRFSQGGQTMPPAAECADP